MSVHADAEARIAMLDTMLQNQQDKTAPAGTNTSGAGK